MSLSSGANFAKVTLRTRRIAIFDISCLLDSYREIVGRISSGRKQIIGAKESSGRSVSRNHREIGKIGRSGRNWLDLRPKLMKSALESVLVFGPKWVSYERSRGICRGVFRHFSARVFFVKIPQSQHSIIYTIFSFFRIHIPKIDSSPKCFSHLTRPPARPPVRTPEV